MVTENTLEFDSGKWLSTMSIFWKICIKKNSLKSVLIYLPVSVSYLYPVFVVIVFCEWPLN